MISLARSKVDSSISVTVVSPSNILAPFRTTIMFLVLENSIIETNEKSNFKKGVNDHFLDISDFSMFNIVHYSPYIVI